MEHKEEFSEEINLLDYLVVIFKKKRLIAIITFGAAVITTIISFIIPSIYKAETKILPPQTIASTQFMVQGGPLITNILGGGGIKTQNDLYIELLKSRTVLDRVIDRFDLMKLYKSKYRDHARHILLDSLKAHEDRKSGIITIGFEDKDPQKAAEIANALVEELRHFNKNIAVTEASQRRLFFEEQLKLAKEGLFNAEESLKGFQEKTGVIKLDTQAAMVVEGIAQLRAQVAAKEVQLKVMKTYATPQNPDIQRIEEEIRGLMDQIGRLEAKSGSRNSAAVISTGRISSLGTEYIRKMREFKYNETLYELLLKQYTSAKLDESRDATLIQIIEKAIPPEKRVKPKRRQMVMLATFVGFFLSVFAAFFMEYKDKASNDPENRERIEAIKRYAAFRLPIRRGRQ
ncbi:MAG: hypothetical protein A2X54_09555 [Nitrospirae bacterium GWF2_44_13]|nr:MAG: hypothetical protein A2X54_09555 [Nitrospirae bacterium GWF2_44_13]OGW32589.1 MAG: hypothetical protein A2088_02475 [Nitrospirae bacterium GWD2_44_7]OGW63493.1 MAG: hypothetical protein A2222_06665 [Nitrospirae bacterium RIFOXYA2_FULL_44_9]